MLIGIAVGLALVIGAAIFVLSPPTYQLTLAQSIRRHVLMGLIGFGTIAITSGTFLYALQIPTTRIAVAEIESSSWVGSRYIVRYRYSLPVEGERPEDAKMLAAERRTWLAGPLDFLGKALLEERYPVHGKVEVFGDVNNPSNGVIQSPTDWMSAILVGLGLGLILGAIAGVIRLLLGSDDIEKGSM